LKTKTEPARNAKGTKNFRRGDTAYHGAQDAEDSVRTGNRKQGLVGTGEPHMGLFTWSRGRRCGTVPWEDSLHNNGATCLPLLWARGGGGGGDESLVVALGHGPPASVNEPGRRGDGRQVACRSTLDTLFGGSNQYAMKHLTRLVVKIVRES